MYGFDGGSPARGTLAQPNWNVFAKLSWRAAAGTSVDVSYGGLGARSEQLGRTIFNRPNRDGWALSNSGSVVRDGSAVLRATATSLFGGFTNEAIASYARVSDGVQSRVRTPLFLVQTPLIGNYIAAGSFKGGEDTETDQRVAELTDNLSRSAGAHLLTVGTQDQLVTVRDNLFINSWGVWTFPTVDAYAQGVPSRYEVALPVRPGGPQALYTSLQAAAYVQDRWTATTHLAVTAGVRLDVPYLQSPARNVSLASDSALGFIDTGRFPSGNAVVSPRVGITYALGRHDSWLVRGGAGGFTSHPPYAWMNNAYNGTGGEQKDLFCNPLDGVPAPVTDISALPARCLNSNGTATPVPAATTFARGTRSPQALKLDLGLDHEMLNGVTTSLDVMHTTTRNALYETDVNLVAGVANAEGRVMYGTPAVGSPSVPRPARLDGTSYGPVYRFEKQGRRTRHIRVGRTAEAVGRRRAAPGRLRLVAGRGYDESREHVEPADLPEQRDRRHHRRPRLAEIGVRRAAHFRRDGGSAGAVRPHGVGNLPGAIGHAVRLRRQR